MSPRILKPIVFFDKNRQATSPTDDPSAPVIKDFRPQGIGYVSVPTGIPVVESPVVEIAREDEGAPKDSSAVESVSDSGSGTSENSTPGSEDKSVTSHPSMSAPSEDPAPVVKATTPNQLLVPKIGKN